MDKIEVIIIFLFISAIGLGIYAITLYSDNNEEVIYEPYYAQKLEENITKGIQFYPRMRFPEREISYFIEGECDELKRANILEAINILSDKTILSFYISENEPRIRFLCSEIVPESGQENHFVAGEGGPTEIVNTSFYSVILSSKVSLYRKDKCNEPKIAIHEILHGLGFDHNNDKKNIMYPITDCSQKLDNFIIEEINEIYMENPSPDLIIESVSAEKVGRYISFQANVSNQGLLDAENVNISIYSEGELLRSYSLGKVSVGEKRIISVFNLRAGNNMDKIIFRAELNGDDELNILNNEAEILIAKKEE